MSMMMHWMNSPSCPPPFCLGRRYATSDLSVRRDSSPRFVGSDAPPFLPLRTERGLSSRSPEGPTLEATEEAPPPRSLVESRSPLSRILEVEAERELEFGAAELERAIFVRE